MITFSKLGSYGRLGNQMFQIASTIGIALRNNQVYAFPEWKYQKHFRYMLPETKVFPKEKYYEGHPYYRDINLSVSADLEGYFQSWKYFEHCKDFIKRQFDLNKTPVDRVAIHVRRGDYLVLPIHPVLSIDYYREAIKQFPADTKFTVFSDDIEWCTNNFFGNDFDFSVGRTDIEDLQFMASHKAVIMANSSFSWWAGYLCGGKVVAPATTYVIGEERDDRIPPEWVKI